MDDFKVRPTSPDTAYGQGSSNTARRKKAKRPEEPAPEQDDVVLISGETDPSETVEDYYTPSQPDEEPGSGD